MATSTADSLERIASDTFVIARPPQGLIRMTGPQAVWYLQNTITADVEDLEPARAVESCFLDLKGKVVAHFLAATDGEAVWLDVDEPGTEPLAAWLVKNRFRTKADIVAAPDGFDPWVLAGPAAAEVAGDGAFVSAEEYVAFGGTLAGVPVAHVFGAKPDAEDAHPGLIEALRLEHGQPRFGADYGPETLPQEAGLTRVVSVEKGCYIGQEVMARLHFRGHVNRTVRALSLSGSAVPEPGGDVVDGDRRVGSVTSAGPTRVGGRAIAMVRVDVPEGGVVVAGGVEAIVGPLPPQTKTQATPRRLGSG